MKTHNFTLPDNRIQSLTIILDGLEHAKKTLSDVRLWSIGYLDPSDIEFYLGIEYLAIQHYLQKTTNDLKDIYAENEAVKKTFGKGWDKGHVFHKYFDKISDHQYNKIQLINACVEYFKHKNDFESSYIKEVRADFNFYDKEKEENDAFYLLTEANEYVNPMHKKEVLIELVQTWRKNVIDAIKTQ